MHALTPAQPITQLNKLLHSLEATHADSGVQQLALAHVSHCDAEEPALQALELPPSLSPAAPPAPRTDSAQLASPTPVQSASAGGRDAGEHAPRTTNAAAARATEGCMSMQASSWRARAPLKSDGRGFSDQPYPSDHEPMAAGFLSLSGLAIYPSHAVSVWGYVQHGVRPRRRARVAPAGYKRRPAAIELRRPT
jgi:hypothetical protein